MKMDWSQVAHELIRRAESPQLDSSGEPLLDAGQQKSLRFLARQLQKHGVVLADEVGTGKTRIACVLMDVVMQLGGRATVVVPRGLLGQWKEEFQRVTTRREPGAGQRVSIEEALVRREPRQLVSWGEFLDGGAGKARGDGEWWLISHAFRFPALQAGSPAWKYALPWLTLLAAEPERREDGRTRLGRLYQQVKDTRRWRGQWEIAEDMAKRLPGDLRRRIHELQLPDWETNADNSALAAQFRRAPRGEGLLIVDELMKRHIGHVDLLIVDEAHKSRDVDDATPRTVLSELIEFSLRTDAETRRLCLTATPMELGIEQWSPLLHRARADVDGPRVQGVLVDLQEAVRGAAQAPDESPRLERLVKASAAFTRTLQPFITRRRRRSERLFQELLPHLPDALASSHPHRNLRRVSIEWERDVIAAGPTWRRLLIALEGIARAARGLSSSELHGWIKTLHTKLASGHVGLDLLDEQKLVTVFPEPLSPQQERFQFWCSEYDAARREQRREAQAMNLPGFDPDTEHPRILAAVRLIEQHVSGDAVDAKDGGAVEKVLCFGVFLKPLRILRDVLNVRHALRCVDRGEPVSASLESLSAVAYRNYQRMLAEGRFSGTLKGSPMTPAAVMKELKRGNRAHINERTRVGRAVDRDVDDELAAHGIELAKTDRERLREVLHTLALDDERAGRGASSWKEDLQRVLGAREEDASGSEADAGADPTTRLLDWINAEHGDDLDGRVRSGFCRLLQGQSHWSTRQALQAAFNRKGAFPMVLLAQSQVGREGLNLHKACRVVVQLHPEWNPAILEQQIGRVDRKGGLWEELATAWLRGGRQGNPPQIEVRQIVFDGTYDALQWERVGQRQHLFDATLFGSLLPPEAWLRASEVQRERLAAAAPDFSPE